ncbi:hypothetical protein AO368_0169 [Moraxella catarrhalis]|nr:hypothetical protein AO371_1076 [Moraxella catarrhalis]OAV33264.1 hypothetical protein AO368_0169 [Moraxella catarrhalis]
MYGYQQINLNHKKAVQKALLFYEILMTGDGFIWRIKITIAKQI